MTSTHDISSVQTGLIGNESLPIQLWQRWFPGLAISNAKIYIFQIKYTKAILSNSTRKLLWLEINQDADCS